MTKLKTRLLKDLPIKTTPISDSDYVINSNNGTTKLKVKDITKNLDENVSKLNSDVKEILEKGITAETVKAATEKEIQKQIANGNMTHLAIADGSITKEKLDPNIKFGVEDNSITSEKIKELKGYTITDVFKNMSVNLFNKDKIDKNGNYNDKGIYGKHFNQWSSPLIEVEEGKTYKRSFGSGVYLTYWDKDERFINGIAWNSGDVTIPTDQNVKYVRFGMPGDVDTVNTAMFTLKDLFPSEYIPYNIYSFTKNFDCSTIEINSKNIKEPLRATMIDAFVRKSENLFNKEIAMTGSYSQTGIYGNYFNLQGSNFIEVEPGETYCRNFPEPNYITFWDKNKQFISGDRWGSSTVTVPNNPEIQYAFFGLNQSSIESCVFMKGKTSPVGYIPFYKYELSSIITLPSQEVANSKWYGKVLSVKGDSITAGNGLSESSKWCTLVKERLGFSKVNNYGASGACLTQMATTGGISSIDPTTDLIIWGGGTNDFTRNVPLGNFGDKTNATFYGALHFILNKLNTHLPTAHIVFTTPIPRLDGINRDETNDIGVKWIDYINAIRETCEYFSIPLLDLYKMSGMKSGKFFLDALHPNINGAIRYADKVCGFIKQL